MLTFAGIDLTSSPKKSSAYALLGDDLRVHSLKSLSTDSEIIATVEHDRPKLVAIDAPLQKPLDLHCFNKECSCPDPPHRACESILRQEGINIYFTTKRTFIKDMIERAIRLKGELESRGHNVIEVYPHASKMRLWKDRAPQGKIPDKRKAAGRSFLREQFIEKIPNIEEYDNLKHDEYDAIIAAYTAYLLVHGNAECIGDSAGGYIVIPLKKDPASFRTD